MPRAIPIVVVALTVALPRIASAAPPKLPAHYAAMFELHHAWTYDASLTTWDYKHPDTVGKGPKVTVRTVINCSVTKVQTFGSTIVSEVTCDQEYERTFKVAGVYAAD